MTTCSECERPPFARGMCQKHYRRAWRKDAFVVREKITSKEAEIVLRTFKDREFSAKEFGDASGLHPQSARMHLDRLVDLGVVARREFTPRRHFYRLAGSA